MVFHTVVKKKKNLGQIVARTEGVAVTERTGLVFSL